MKSNFISAFIGMFIGGFFVAYTRRHHRSPDVHMDLHINRVVVDDYASKDDIVSVVRRNHDSGGEIFRTIRNHHS